MSRLYTLQQIYCLAKQLLASNEGLYLPRRTTNTYNQWHQDSSVSATTDFKLHGQLDFLKEIVMICRMANHITETLIQLQ